MLVKRGLAESRSKAQALILAGKVLVGGKPSPKPGSLVPEDIEVRLIEPPPFVSRGGIKLEHALSEFGLDISAKVAADIGASTGGFTDCLLKRGASRVYAIDVGYGQLALSLREDPRVVVMERVNARYPLPIKEKVDLATIDLSFISAKKVLPSVAEIVKNNGFILLLLKPQFEARRSEVGKGGVIKDPVLHAKILGRFIAWIAQEGFRLKGLIPSPILGGEGNKEFFILLKNRSSDAN